MQVPPHLQHLDARPGTDWTEAEIQQLVRWWFAPVQLRRVWYYAARYLGPEVTRQDIEDAAVDFYFVFEQARQAYRPGGASFASFLLHVCFKHHCLRLSGRIRKRAREEQPLDRPAREGLTYVFELVDTRPDSDAAGRAQGQAFLTTLAEVLNTPVLSEKHKQVFVLRYFKSLSYEEIARQIGAPVGSVKVWVQRATAKIRTLLTQRGWSSAIPQELLWNGFE